MQDIRAQLQSSLGTAYAIGRELGGGGMSRVFVADETALGRKVVVKVLAPELAAGINAERFTREIRLAASLQQANIVPVLAAGANGGLPYYTMPFVEGLSLRQRLERGPLPIAEVCSVLRDVARALAYAHGRGIVHRDIKPDNVLLSGETAVVTDFGIAKALSASRTEGGAGLTHAGAAIGTPAYMAPEQGMGDPATDHRADVYALGCLAYELLAGHAPFPGLAPHRLLVAHMTERPTPVEALRPDTPPGLARLVAGCLEKDPARRPQSAGEILQALEAVTTSGARGAAPALGPGLPLARALAAWAAATAAVAVVARAAMIALGLPDWVLPGALVVMALGLAPILLTWWAQRVVRRHALATPQHTPGGTLAPRRSNRVDTLALRAAPHVSWRRTARGGWLAVGGFAALVASFMALRALGIGPAGSLLAAGKLGASAPLLVAEFQAPGADSTLGRVVAEAVRAGLGQSRVVGVVPASRVRQALERMRRPADTRLDLAMAREIAQREGIGAVVTGEVAALGGGAYILTARLVNAATGDELASTRETAGGADELIPAIDRATRTLRGRIGESLKVVRGARPLETATTASLDALRAYTAARGAQTAGDHAAAIAGFERAIALDTSFALAYTSLAATLANSNQQAQRRDTLLARAYALRGRLPDQDRLRVTASYFRMSAHAYDRARAAVALESLAVMDSSDYGSLINLGNLYMSRAEYARAESTYRRADRTAPGLTLIRSNIVYALLSQRRWREADSVLALIPDRGASYPRLAEYAIFAPYARGRADSSLLLARRAAAGPRPEISLTARRAVAWHEQRRGRPEAAARIGAEVARAQAARGSARPAVLDSLDRALVDFLFSDDSAAGARRVAAALRAEPLERWPLEGRPYVHLALHFALVGDTLATHEWLARYDAAVRDSNLVRQGRPLRAAAAALLHLARGRWDDALREIDASFRDPDGGPTQSEAAVHFWRAYILDAAGRRDRAIAEYEAFLAAPALFRLRADATLLAPALQRLAALHEARGNARKAIDHYGRFLELWKDAEPDLQPRVREARERRDRLLARTG